MPPSPRPPKKKEKRKEKEAITETDYIQFKCFQNRRICRGSSGRMLKTKTKQKINQIHFHIIIIALVCLVRHPLPPPPLFIIIITDIFHRCIISLLDWLAY